MSGRSNRGGRTSTRGGGRGSGRGWGDNRAASYKHTATPKILGMTKELGPHVFDHGDKGAADQVRISWEKLTNYASTLYGTGIGTELATCTRFHIPKPKHFDEDIAAHEASEIMRKEMATLMKAAVDNEITRIAARIRSNREQDVDVGEAPAMLVGKTYKSRLLQIDINKDEPLQLKGEAKTEFNTNLKIYKAKVQALEKYCGQAFSMIKGQCTLALETKMKCNNDYVGCMSSNNPLRLKALIERTIISQSVNKYTFAVL
jgi:hypothetical protein